MSVLATCVTKILQGKQLVFLVAEHIPELK